MSAHGTLLADVLPCMKLPTLRVLFYFACFQLAFVLYNGVIHGEETYNPNKFASEYFDIPDDEIILVNEYRCMKHIAKGEMLIAKSIKWSIDLRRTDKLPVSILRDNIPEFQRRLKEAQIAKAKAGNQWGCNPSEGTAMKPKEEKETLTIYEIKTPSPNFSFISTDALQFRAKVEGSKKPHSSINWASEDGKADKIESGVLNPTTMQNSPDYPKDLLLQANPPLAPEGRNGRLSYKITASAGEGADKQQASVLIRQDELDQLRQEYVDMKKQCVPSRDEFTKGGGKFNTGDYSWAIVSLKMVEGYKIIVENYLPHPAKINSAYRNPVHNAKIKPQSGKPESRHIYGDAVDIQTVAVGHSGQPNEEDWYLLYKLAEKARPSYREPAKISGTGHLHVDWK